MHSVVCDAIRDLRVLRFHYDGGSREAEPHTYGRSKAGNDLLRAYQLSGVSRSGESIGWKLFRLDEMTGISITDQRFAGPRQGYDRFDDAMTHIYCRL